MSHCQPVVSMPPCELSQSPVNLVITTRSACRKEQERKERLQRAREFEEAAWAAETEASEDDPEETYLSDELYCLACDKTFRSQNALTNHEK